MSVWKMICSLDSIQILLFFGLDAAQRKGATKTIFFIYGQLYVCRRIAMLRFFGTLFVANHELNSSISTLEMTIFLQWNSLFYNQLISVPLIGEYIFIPKGKYLNAFTVLNMRIDTYVFFVCLFVCSLYCMDLFTSFTIILVGTFYLDHIERPMLTYFDSIDTCWSCTKSLYTKS